MEFVTGVAIGLLVALLLVIWISTQRDKLLRQLIETVSVARSENPVKAAEGLAVLEDARVLRETKPVSITSPEPAPIKTVTIDSVDFEFPTDSPLHKLA